MFAIAVLAIGLAIYLNLPHPQVFSYTTPVINSEGISKDVNLERTSRGLGTLAVKQELNIAAQNKCLDMQSKNYWAHNDPTNQTPWHFIKEQGVVYQKAGENLAYGQISDAQVVSGWMNSPTHRDNILNPAFSQVGYGICDFRNTKLVVQHFTN